MRAYIREIQFIEIEKYILPDTKNTFQNTHFQKRLINTNIWLKQAPSVAAYNTCSSQIHDLNERGRSTKLLLYH